MDEAGRQRRFPESPVAQEGDGAGRSPDAAGMEHFSSGMVQYHREDLIVEEMANGTGRGGWRTEVLNDGAVPRDQKLDVLFVKDESVAALFLDARG